MQSSKSLLLASALAMLAAQPAAVNPSGGPELSQPGQTAKQGGEKNRNGIGLADQLRLLRSLSGAPTPRRGGYKNRAGWTNRRYQRAALKRRNQARQRAHC